MNEKQRIILGVLCSLYFLFTSLQAEEIKNCQKIERASMPGVSNTSYVEYKCSGQLKLPENFDSTSGPVKVLDMDRRNNSLGILTAGALVSGNLKSLVRLHLEKCEIRGIEPGAFKGGKEIVQLYLRDNLIEVLDPTVFSDLENLKSLWLVRNPLKQFKNDFPMMKTLETIDLGQCQLTSIPNSVVKNLENLRNLFLEKNFLTTIDWKIARPLQKLKEIWLYENPWHCDCHIGFLLEYLQRRKIDLKLQQIFSDLKCKTTHDHLPSSIKKNLTATNWMEIDTDLLICPPQISDLKQISPIDKTDLGSVSFLCNLAGAPPPQVKWMKDGKRIEVKPGKVEIIEMPNIEVQCPEVKGLQYEFSQKLVIKNANIKNDGGRYECVISSSAGSASKAVFLNSSKTIFQELPTGRSPQIVFTSAAVVGRNEESSGNTFLVLTLVVLILIIIVLLSILIKPRIHTIHEVLQNARTRWFPFNFTLLGHGDATTRDEGGLVGRRDDFL